MVALIAITTLLCMPSAKADIIYTFFDSHGNTILEFASPYIITPSTNPITVSSFIVAPNGFLPCTLSIKTTSPNTLGCITASHGSELWAISTSAKFPTAPGSFTLTFGDTTWGFAGDIELDGGSISPEPASLMLFGTGVGALGLWKLRQQRRQNKT